MISLRWLLYGLLVLVGVESALLARPFIVDDGRSGVDIKKMGNMEMLVLDASRRSIVVSSGGQYCSEPVPDAANTLAKEFATKLSGEKADAKGAAELSQFINVEISKLFERSQGIQALRDGMYRLCEAYMNHAISEGTYQEHIANLTATLNFIVPIELCSKLNREIVAAISGAAGSIKAPASEDPAKAAGDRPAEKPADGVAQGTIQPPGGGWLAVMANSELLTNKFTTSCLSIGSDFASRMAATSNILASARYEERMNAKTVAPTAAPGPLSSK